MGLVSRSQGEYARAADLFAASLAYGAGQGPNTYDVARALCHLGRSAFLGGHSDIGARHIRDGLLIMRDVTLAGDTLADCLDWLAAAQGDAGQPVDAARLFGAADAQWEASGAVRYAPEQAVYTAELARVREQLDANTFPAAWAEGNAMSAEQAIDYALELCAVGNPA